MHPPNATLRLHERFHSAFLPDDRDVTVWLPPGYDEGSSRGFPTGVPHEGSSRGFPTRVPHEGSSRGNHRYPVMYMHDGQNLFDPDTAFQKGEHWRVGETAAALIDAGRIEPLIVVGIHNTGPARLQEYTPTPDTRLGGGLANDYGRLIVEELKPFIDATYRTRPEAASTGLGGSSLGGLVTLHLGYAHPDVFSKLAVLSPSVWWDRRSILRTVRRTRPRPPLKIWVDMGTAEGHRGVEDARLLKTALVGAGFVEGRELHYAEYEGATHDESAWATRVAPMLEWLFPAAEVGWPPPLKLQI